MSSADIRIFSPKISNFFYVGKYRQKIHFNAFFNSFGFIKSLKVVLTNVIAILMMPTKIATPGFLKIKAF